MDAKKLFVLLLLSAVLYATPFATTPEPPQEVLYEQLQIVLSLAVPLIVVMTVIAALVYIIGQLFGAETRARANTYVSGLISAILISVGVLVLLYTILPSVLTGTPVTPRPDEIGTILNNVRDLAQSTLLALVVIMVILASAIYVIGQMFGAETRARANVWATGVLAAAIVSAIIYVLVFEIIGGLRATLFATLPYGLASYSQIIVTFIFFMTAFILVTYILSKFLRIPEWEAYLNIELSNLINSILILLFVLALFQVGISVAEITVKNAFIIPQGVDVTTPPRAAIYYMQTVVLGSVIDALSDVYRIQVCTSILSLFAKRTGETVLSTVFKIFPGIDVFVSITNVLAFGLMSLSGSITAQIFFLYLSDATMRNVVLPAGLILRFIPPTREAGTFLISLAFGLFIIFPTTYVINGMALNEITGGDDMYDSPTALIYSLCGPFKYGVATIVLGGSTALFRLVPGGGTLGGALTVIFSEGVLNAISMAEFIPIIQHLSKVSLIALFMPALSTVLTIGFINAMTKFLVMKV